VRILCTKCGETIDLDDKAYGSFTGNIKCKFCKATLYLITSDGRIIKLR